jgi:hypothetical protein
MLYLSGEKACICGACGGFHSAKKSLGPQIANLQNTTPQITKINWVYKLAFRKSATFAEGPQI